MKFEFIYDPVPIIIIRDLFTKKENKDILAEAVKNKKKFEHSVIGGDSKNDPSFRSNTVAYYDTIYKTDRTKSKLLSKVNDVFSDKKIQSLLSSSPYPLHFFTRTNYHETQVSRYGNEGQEYKYHIDAGDNSTRQLSFVYYFHEEPKKWKGGEISFTHSPIYNGTPLDKNTEPITITPENNMAVIFGSYTAHMVKPTTSPKTFSKGRFSVNCWIGVK